MKILVTGPIANTTDKEYSNKRSRIKSQMSHDALIEILTRLGHIVTCKPVEIGEDLSMYDDLLIVAASFESNLSLFTDGVLYAISKFPNFKVTFNDWRVKQAYNYFTTDKNYVDGSFKNLINKRHDNKERLFESHKEDLRAGHEILKERNNTILFPAYNSANLDLLNFDNPTIGFNPDKFVNHSLRESKGLPKEKRHILASVSKPNWSFYQKISPLFKGKDDDYQIPSKWPVELYGNWSKQFGGRLVTEDDLFDIIDQSMTCILPTYSTIRGVGMWRPRHRSCYESKTIVICDEFEASFLGDGYNKYSFDEIESLNDIQLKQLAELQANSFEKLIDSEEFTLETINSVFS